jgi:2-polyprenyl-3-methyl-5-hydroxy-6-metoxy-1,4-benzoquinol methylase
MNNYFLDFFELRGRKFQIDGNYLVNGQVKISMVNGIPRFTPDISYSTGNFSKLRDEFAVLQLDSQNETQDRYKTILKRTNWPKEFFRGKTILECGTGAGPDTEVLLNLGAKVMAVDIAGLDVAKRNLGDNSNLQLVQASIDNLPLKKKSFDIVFCHRVLQHTPNPAQTLDHILQFVKDDGAVFVHSYSRTFRQMFRWKYALRPITRRMDSEKLFRLIQAYSRPAFKLTKFLNSFFLGRMFAWVFIPFLNYGYKPDFANKSDEYLLEYGIHDTFDALSPRYDRPTSVREMKNIAAKYLRQPFEVVECGVTLLRSLVTVPFNNLEKTYSLKEGYIPNQQLETMDEISQKVYWKKETIYSASFHQFYVYKYLVSLIRQQQPKTIIDVGCGVGVKLAYVHYQVPAVEIIGIDQKSAIEYCQKHYDFGTWQNDDFENPRQDLEEVKADLVVCADVIEHVLDPDKLLAYLKNKMTNNGYLLISTPERDKLRGEGCNYSPNKHHIREWNKSEFLTYLEQSGLVVISYYLEYPIKIGWNRIFISHFLRWLKNGFSQGLAFRSTQVVLLKKK